MAILFMVNVEILLCVLQASKSWEGLLGCFSDLLLIFFWFMFVFIFVFFFVSVNM